MIGRAAVVSGGLAVVVAALLVGGGGTGPAATIAERQVVRERVAVARAALDELAEQLDRALESARRGAAAVVAGDESPEVHLGEAADQVAAARETAAEADATVRALRAVPRGPDDAAGPPTADVPLPPDAVELAAIEAELRAAASTAEGVSERRRQAEDVLAAMVAARDSLRDGRLDEAADALADARGHRADLAAWDAAPPELSIWLAATDAMISAVESMIDGARAGAEDEVEAAARRLASLSAEAATADRALRIAVDETAASAVSGPVGRLGGAAAAAERSRAAVTVIASEGAR